MTTLNLFTHRTTKIPTSILRECIDAKQRGEHWQNWAQLRFVNPTKAEIWAKPRMPSERTSTIQVHVVIDHVLTDLEILHERCEVLERLLGGCAEALQIARPHALNSANLTYLDAAFIDRALFRTITFDRNRQKELGVDSLFYAARERRIKDETDL